MTLFATATEVKNNFGFYSKHVENGDDIYITKNGTPFGVFRQLDKSETPLTKALLNANVGEIDFDKERDEYFKEKYGITY